MAKKKFPKDLLKDYLDEEIKIALNSYSIGRKKVHAYHPDHRYDQPQMSEAEYGQWMEQFALEADRRGFIKTPAGKIPNGTMIPFVEGTYKMTYCDEGCHIDGLDVTIDKTLELYVE